MVTSEHWTHVQVAVKRIRALPDTPSVTYTHQSIYVGSGSNGNDPTLPYPLICIISLSPSPAPLPADSGPVTAVTVLSGASKGCRDLETHLSTSPIVQSTHEPIGDCGFSLPEFIVASATTHPPPPLSGGGVLDGLGNCGFERLQRVHQHNAGELKGFSGYPMLDAELEI
ncbi:hypothetical protein Pfo_025664 [Paulownia fortunei]|nr:hypothetical protein Pfo_025664 [Paulownia fortunei]